MNMLSFRYELSGLKKTGVFLLYSLALLALPNLAKANVIGDFIWEDLNTNGVQDVGEPGIAGVPVYLYDASSNFVEGTATDGSGFYQFTNVANGTYFLNLPLPLTFIYFATTNDAGGDDNRDSDFSEGHQTAPFVFSGVALTNLDAGFVKYQPGIQVTKTASDSVKSAPDGTPLYVTNNTWVTYTYVITNTGNANLSYVFLSDDILFPGGLSPNPLLIECPSQFAPGQSLTYTTQTLINASVTNVAYVQAFAVNKKTCDFLDLDPVEDQDDAVVLLVHPGYTFDKALSSPLGRAAVVGENIRFTITVNNTGDTAFVTVPVSDTYDTNYIAYVSAVPPSVNNDNDGLINWTNIGPLAAFSSRTITATFTAVRSTLSQPFTNIAITAPQTATNVPGVPPQTNDAPYEISDPGYTITKTVSSPAMPAVIGDTVTFQIQVVNTGDVTLVTVPLVDTYDTNYLSYISSVPPSVNNTNDGVINWANVGPLAPGQSTNVFASFLAYTNTFGLDKTNLVVANPTVPVDEPPVPPQTSSVPYEIITPAFLHLDKDFISASEPDTNGNFQITYTVTVQNSGEANGVYNLVDTPAPDTNVTINGGIVTGHTNLTLVGPGPYALATNETIIAGATHVYTMRLDAVVSAAVLSGETSVSLCGGFVAPIQPGQGLYNEVLLRYGVNDTRVFTNACGDVPPVVSMQKNFVTATYPQGTNGSFEVTYTITVVNSGGSSSTYDLTDTPDPDPNVTIQGGDVSGQTNAVLLGAGPYTFASNATILAGATHVYTVRLDAVLSAGVVNGATNVSLCSGGEDTSLAGEGLFNAAVIVYGTNDTVVTNTACGDVPPLIVLNKDFVSASEIDGSGNFVVTYTITVQNTGGSGTTYDLTDTPNFDPSITVFSNNVSDHVVTNFAGSGPYTIVVAEPIVAGGTHVYTMTVFAQVSADVLSGETTVSQCELDDGEYISGQGLFNEALLIYGPSQITVIDDACGDIPPVVVLNKDFLSASAPDGLGNFSVWYTITVENSGGSASFYDLTDTPAPDPNVSILGGAVTGYTNLTLTGAGPYLLASNEVIAAGAVNLYTVRLDAALSADVLSGVTNVSYCGSRTQVPTAGEGLFNEAVVVYGTNDTAITNNACGDVPPFIVSDKSFITASEPDVLGNFTIDYVLTVFNPGGSAGTYDLTDTPSPDPNIFIIGGTVTGYTHTTLIGGGPYTLALNEAIAAGATHSYTVRLDAVFSGLITSGATNATYCGQTTGTAQAGEGLFNEAIVVFGTNDVTVTNTACGDPPPFLVIQKDFVATTDPDVNGNFEVRYLVTVQNSGGSSTTYDLTDTPSPDPGIDINGGDVSGHTNIVLTGAGPYQLAMNELIESAVIHVYTVRLDAVMTSDLIFAEDPPTECGEIPQPGEALFNEAVVVYGDSDITLTNDACGEIPPYILMDKNFIGSTEPDALGAFTVTYNIVVYNAGGSAGSYSLTDTPMPDPNVTINGGNVSGYAAFALVGSGPFTIATSEPIDVAATHTYTVTLNAQLSSNVMTGATNVTLCGQSTGSAQAGEGLFNEAVVTFGDNGVMTTSSVCGDIPPFMQMEKEFISSSDPAVDGSFQVDYRITVHNSGGTQGTYDLTDSPAFDPEITATGAMVVGQSSQTNATLNGQPTFTRPIASGYNAACALGASPGGNQLPYAVIPIVASSGDLFTARVSGGVNDPYMFMYCNFDPSQPTLNMLAARDDFFGLQSAFPPSFGMSLTAGLTNYIVVSLFSSNSIGTGNFILTVGGPVAFNESAVDFAGAGPYAIASSKVLPAGSTHTYTVTVYAVYSADVLNGTTNPTPCGVQVPQSGAGEGLFNQATLQFGANDITVTNETCGDPPPFLILDKNFVSVSGPDSLGNILITYELTVFNSGGSSGAYDLTDTPIPDTNVTINGGVVTGHTNLLVIGAGPYSIVSGEVIGAGVLHVYTVLLSGVMSADLMLGDAIATTCGLQVPQPESALYNEAAVTYGIPPLTITNSACGEIPPVPVTNVGDTVWVDLNANGIIDENIVTQGLNNVRVDLYRVVSGVTNFVDFQLTYSNATQRGFYIFTNLPVYGVYLAAVDVSTVPPTINVPTTPIRYFVPPTPGLNADFGFKPGNPTAVELLDFHAEVDGGSVSLFWETATELDNMGFNLYRATSADGDRSLVNSGLIPGRGTGLGGSYSYVDSESLADGTYYYWLEDVEFNGSIRTHGPLRVTVGAVGNGSDTIGSAEVSESGLVMITAATFDRSGINIAAIDPSRLRVYVDGVEVAAYVSASGIMMQSYDYILAYLSAHEGSAVVSVGYSADGDPMRMGIGFAFAQSGDGDVLTAGIEDGSDQLTVNLTQAYARCLLTGFTDSIIWLLDVTSGTNPALLIGGDVMSAGGEYGLYFTYPAESGTIYATGAAGIREIESLDR